MGPWRRTVTLEDTRTLRRSIGLWIRRGQAWNLGENRREALDSNFSFEALEDAAPHRHQLSRREAPSVPRPLRRVATRDVTIRGERSHHRRPDRDVGTRVEEIGRLPVEARRPRHRDGDQTEARAPTLPVDRLRELERLLGRRQVVMSLERDEVADEEWVRVRDLPDKRLDQPVVRVKAARQDDGQEVHRGVAAVRAERETGPK